MSPVSPERIFVGLGSNLADPLRQVRDALDALAELEAVAVVATSSLYRTAPWGVTDQPSFVNAVTELRARCSPDVLLDQLLTIERDAGRRRLRRWGPRIIDLDILAWGGRTLGRPGLTIPHPRLAERDFVLLPWAEIAPAFVVPGYGPVATLVAALEDAAGDTPRPRPERLEETACTDRRRIIAP